MKNKKLLIAGVLAAFLMLAVPFAVASVDSEDSYASGSEPVAMIDDASYNTLQEAIDAAESEDTIIVQRDVEVANNSVHIIFEGDRNITLDLNGYSITQTGGKGTGLSYPMIVVRPETTLSIVDSTESDGKISAKTTAVQLQGTLNLISGTISLDSEPTNYEINEYMAAYGIWFYNPEGKYFPTFNMSGGKITFGETQKEFYYAHALTIDDSYGTVNYTDSITVNVTGGMLEGSLCLPGASITIDESVLVDAVAKLGDDCYYDDLDKALWEDTAGDILILEDINVDPETNYLFEITRPITIDGNGKTISCSKASVSDFRLFDIILADGEVTIENLTLNLAGGNYSRTLNINNADGLVVNVIDSTINNGTHYAINITGSNKDVELNIIRTEIIDATNDAKGYCAIQTWSEKADINITNSKIYGNNTYNGVSNAFGAIVVNPLSEANITITDSKIITKDVDSQNAPEYSILYKGDSKGKLKLVGDVEFISEGVTEPRILLSEGGLDVDFGKSSATIEVSGNVTGLDILNLPVGSTFTMMQDSVFSGTIYGPGYDSSIGFNNVKAGDEGIVIKAGSLSISGSMIPSGIGSITSGTITLSGDDVFISGTVESGVTIEIDDGCEPTIVDSLTFKDGSTLDFLGTDGKFSDDSGDVYYNAGSIINGDVKSEDQKINASTGASYEKVTVSLRTNGPMYPDQSSVEVFVGDYYMDTLGSVVFHDDMGYILEGWYTEFGLKITDLTKVNNSITTLVANFVYDPSSAPVSPGAPGSAEPEESSGFDIADHVVLIEAVIAVIVLIGFVAYIRKN